LTGDLDICQDQGRVVFTATGTYQLVVDSNDGGVGPFTVTWQTSRPDQNRPLRVDVPAVGTIDKPGAVDRWTFTAQANATLRVAPTASCTASGLSWTVLNQTGTPIAGSTAMCAGDIVAVPDAGRYQVVISGTGAATGSYAFTAAVG